jgi:aarF domain-containing kinase
MHSSVRITIGFDEVPIASASLAQVHKAIMKSTKDVVAVKVQHKWVKERCTGDIKLIKMGVKLGEYLFPGFKYEVYNLM